MYFEDHKCDCKDDGNTRFQLDVEAVPTGEESGFRTFKAGKVTATIEFDEMNDETRRVLRGINESLNRRVD